MESNGDSEPDEKTTRAQEEFADNVLAIVLNLAEEVSPQLRQNRIVALDSDLDRDIGLDSLARSELVFRLDKEFRVKLPDRVLVEAATPRDLLIALKNAKPALLTPKALHQSKYSGLKQIDEPFSAATLIEAFQFHVDRHPDRPHLKIWLSEDHQENFTYGELHREALKIAKGLIDLGVVARDRVAIMLGTDPTFFSSFMGTLYSGAIPVPIYPPFRPSQIEDHLRRQAGILLNARAKILLIGGEMQSIGSLLYGLVSDLKAIETPENISTYGSMLGPLRADADTVALIQYTSGSTGDPKGVVLTHANLLANIRAMGKALEANSSDVFVSWLPLYHDMGLIGAWLGSMYYGAHAVIMPPLAFLADPSRWLRVIHDHRATLSAAPNFAFELCCKSIRKEQIEGLDLSSIRLVVNGAEPVSPITIERFSKRFAPYGFRPEMLGPVYGLAENSVGLAFPPLDRVPLVDRIKRDLLASEGRAVPATEEDQTAISFVACGRPIPGHEIRIVDDAGRELPERFEGQLHFRGPSATAGYFENEEKTRALFSDGWLDSGDRAYMHNGDVFITGRVKDMIIKAGRNIYPNEIEELTGQVEGVRKGCVAAISSPDPHTGSERLVLVVESRLATDDEKNDLRQRIIDACTLKLETPPDIVEIVPPRIVPKTSSGKIRRAATREMYDAGLLTARQSRLWVQLVRLWISGLVSHTKRVKIRLMELAFAGYWWTLIIVITIIAWPVVIVLPIRRLRHNFVHYLARIFLQLTGSTPELLTKSKVPISGCTIVSNHSSYLDSLVLCAILRGPLVFTAKKELSSQWIAGPFLSKLGTIFVRRTTVTGGVKDSESMTQVIRSGERVVTFPEGTLTRMSGLLPFRTGAFLSAAQTGTPIVPIALQGTRSILRGGQWFPRNGTIKVWIGTPILPNGVDFSAAIVLRDKVRAVILDHSEEPDLANERIEL